MCKLLPVSICMTLLLIVSGLAEEPRPGAATEVRPSIGLNQDKLDQDVEHLLKAAEHLEAAGLVEESARVRDDARQRALRDNVLSRKEAELECLQEEVDRLRQLTGQVPLVRIEIVAIEVDRAKLGLKARDFDRMVGFTQTASSSAAVSTPASAMAGRAASWQSFPGSSGIVEANPWQLPLFRELREKGAIDVLAHPTVQTVARRPASISVGGEIPIRVKSPTGDVSIRSVPFGTHVEVRAVVLPNQRIRLQVALELTKVIGDGVVEDDGTTFPGISSRRLSTEVEMQLGQTLAVGRMIFDRPVDDGRGGAGRGDANRDNDRPDKSADANEGKASKATSRPIERGYAPTESRETVVFITPRLVQASDVPQAMPIVPAAALDESGGANVPADYVPTDGDVFGPVIPVMKRRTKARD